MDVVHARLPDDAHDRERITSVTKPYANWTHAPEKPARERLIDDGLADARLPRRLEGAPGQEANAHHFEISGARGDEIDGHGVARRITEVPRCTGNPERPLRRDSRKGQGWRCAGASHAGDLRKRALDPILKGDGILGAWIVLGRRTHEDRQHAVGTEARV